VTGAPATSPSTTVHERVGPLALAHLADELGAPELAAEGRRLAERLAEGRFYVVCLGQFKRGKSTLLNALVGQSVLPTGVIPVTSVVTVIRHGAHLAARIRRGSGDWEDCDPAALAAYVTEERNPANEKRISAVEVFVPSPILESGLCLVDTPGVGSISTVNTEAARAFVPHVDAALVVLGADPPISADELALIEDVNRVTTTIIVVLNKADRLPDAERAEALRFTERVLGERLGRSVDPIYQVSATDRLSQRAAGRDWAMLAERLAMLARTSGAELVRAAERRETAGLVARILRDLAEREAALRRPLADSESRIAILRRAVAEAEASLEDLGHRLAAAHARLSRRFSEERERFFARALPGARGELAAAVQRERGGGSSLRARAVDQAIAIVERWLDQWRREQEPRVEALYREATARFVELVNSFQPMLAVVPDLPRLPPIAIEVGLRARSRVHYTEMLATAPLSTTTRLLDIVGPRSLRRRAVGRDAHRYLERLLEINSARVTNDFEARVSESRRGLEEELRARLRNLSASAERALAAARLAQTAGTAAVSAELLRLARLRATVLPTRAEAA
jgi:GTP-binding protein EngB required for normal cell division